MTINDFRQNLRNTIRQIEQDRLRLLSIAAHDALANISSRVIEEGKKADGTAFGDYSEADVPFWFYQGTKQTAARKKHGDFFSYKEWREINGRQTDHKDFSFTGAMWKNIKVIPIKHTAAITIISIGATLDKEKKKLAWNQARDGQILELSKQEKSMIQKQNTQRILNIIKSNGL